MPAGKRTTKIQKARGCVTKASTLTMNIKRNYFADIVAGRKKVENRDLLVWFDRLERMGRPLNLRLLNGMSPPVPEAIVQVKRVVIDEHAENIAFHLGDVVSVAHWDRKNERPC